MGRFRLFRNVAADDRSWVETCRSDFARRTTGLVKVFGRRPSQVEGDAWGRRTETAQARTRGVLVRRYGDLRILVRLNGWGGVCEMRFARRGWW